MAISRRTSRDLDIPEGLLSDIEAIANAQGVTAAEVVRTALERFVVRAKLQSLASIGHLEVSRMGLTEDDVPRLIEESRKEFRKQS